MNAGGETMIFLIASFFSQHSEFDESVATDSEQYGGDGGVNDEGDGIDG